MKEQIVTLETAKLAKEKGFDYPTIDYFELDDESKEEKWLEKYPPYYDFGYTNYNSRKNEISRPTQSLLQKWLREKHNIHIEIYCNASGWGWILTKLNGTSIKQLSDYKFLSSFEIALEAGLQQALKLIPENK